MARVMVVRYMFPAGCQGIPCARDTILSTCSSQWLVEFVSWSEQLYIMYIGMVPWEATRVMWPLVGPTRRFPSPCGYLAPCFFLFGGLSLAWRHAVLDSV
jgi:hypothetical protein